MLNEYTSFRRHHCFLNIEIYIGLNIRSLIKENVPIHRNRTYISLLIPLPLTGTLHSSLCGRNTFSGGRELCYWIAFTRFHFSLTSVFLSYSCLYRCIPHPNVPRLYLHTRPVFSHLMYCIFFSFAFNFSLPVYTFSILYFTLTSASCLFRSLLIIHILRVIHSMILL